MICRLLPLTVCVALTVTFLPLVNGAENKPVNVLFLLADDQRPDTIAALGNKHIQTPNLDQLVQQGFVFERAYCMGSTMGAVCNPSRHMIQSGMSLYRYEQKPTETTPSLARSFRSAGYETYHHSKRSNTAQQYHQHYEHSHYLNDNAERSSGHHGRTAADDAIEFLVTRDKSRPFFMYVGFAGPHDPRVAAPQWMNRYERTTLPLPKNFQPFHHYDNGEMFVRDEKLAPWPRTEEVVREHLHDYYSCITSIDHHIGRIFAVLKQLEQYENTIIVFSADHGLAIGSHGLFGKQNLYEHSMKVPMIFCGPGIPQGKSQGLMYLYDLFPTLCDLAQLEVPANIDGKSQKPVLTGDADAVRSEIYLTYRECQRAVIKGKHKLIRYPLIDTEQLFDLQVDPDERTNLINSAEHAELKTAMQTLLNAQHDIYEDPHPLVSEKPGPAEVQDANFFLQEAAVNKNSAGKALKKKK